MPCYAVLCYAMLCYACFLEVFECVRKVSLVGLPVFFEPGSSEQLMFGLLVCFVTITIFACATRKSRTSTCITHCLLIRD